MKNIKYLLPSEQDISWGLVVTTTGHQQIDAGMNYPSAEHPLSYRFLSHKGRVLDEYQLVYISRGRGSFASDSFRRDEIREGTMFLLFPGEWHSYAPDPQTGWCESWIGFLGSNMDNRRAAGFFSPRKPIFRVGVKEEILALFKQAVKVSQQQGVGYQQTLAGIVNMLLGMSYVEDRMSSYDSVSETINRAKIYMQESLSSEVSYEKIAQEVGMSYSWFRRVFKDYTGFSPAQYLCELRISKAKELLIQTDLSCQQIAYETGFETPAYFNAVFRKKTDMTPAQYRKSVGVKRSCPQPEPCL